MRDHLSKRRPSASGKEDHDMLAPSDVHVATTIELSGKYGTAPATFSGLRYGLGSVLQNPHAVVSLSLGNVWNGAGWNPVEAPSFFDQLWSGAITQPRFYQGPG